MENPDEGKNLAAMALGKLGGANGGAARRKGAHSGQAEGHRFEGRSCQMVKAALKHISTSYVERQNLTMRMSMRRFTRLTNASSKKLENHAAMVAV